MAATPTNEPAAESGSKTDEQAPTVPWPAGWPKSQLPQGWVPARKGPTYRPCYVNKGTGEISFAPPVWEPAAWFRVLIGTFLLPLSFVVSVLVLPL